jgi:DNA-binding PadR family transcriptional regulator
MYRADTSVEHIDVTYRPHVSPSPAEGATVARRSGVLELAVLGLLHSSPLHGYELRKRLNTLLGSFRALSYGSLYPALRDLQARGYLLEQPADEIDPPAAPGPMSRRSRVVYSLTADGKERLEELLADAGPDAWEDDTFGVHFAFFGQTAADVRLRILEGRRIRLEERQATVRTSMTRTREKLDSYTLELQRHGLESVEREVRWLNELIATERSSADGQPRHGTTTTPSTTS